MHRIMRHGTESFAVSMKNCFEKGENTLPKIGSISVEERKERILELLQKEGKVRCAELSRLFSISEVSVRNTLSAMEQEGLVERTHGGAVLASAVKGDRHYLERKGRYTEEKRRIAKQIAGMIQSGETLFVNSGTTTLFVVEELQKLSALTIVTNSIPMAMEFSDYPNFNIILLGGNIDLTHSFTYGDDALAQLRKYRADKLILSIDGISLEKGLTTYYFQEVAINKMMMERVERNIVAADFSKIGAESFSYVTDISQVDCLVTNASANTGELQKLRDAGIEICLA